jgi:hypothetical protein
MKRHFVLAVILIASVMAWAQDDRLKGKMLKIDFYSEVDEGMTMNLSLPLSLIETVKPKIEEILNQVQAEQEGFDFVEIWNQVKDVGPTEFVDIKSKEANIKVSTNEQHLRVDVFQKLEGRDIRVVLPMALGDALFANGKRVDYDAILNALLDMQGQDLVKVEAADMRGRVWIE